MIEKIRDAHVVGIRSKTKLTKAVLDEAKNLLAIGCFCIGTNQVDLKHAANKGVSLKQGINRGDLKMITFFFFFDG